MLIPVSVVKPSWLSEPTLPPVPGYIAHYDLSDLSTVTLSGQAVTGIADKSSSGFNFSVGGGVTIGMLGMTPSGRAAMFTSGSQGGGYYAAGFSTSDLSSSRFAVLCLPTVNSASIIVGTSATGGAAWYVKDTAQLTVDRAGVIEMARMAATVPIGSPFVGGMVLTAGDVTQYLNLTPETDVHGQPLTAALTGQLWGNVGAAASRGWIGEIVIYDTSLSSGDAQAVIQYLMMKWKV